jgi:hypothetical protein
MVCGAKPKTTVRFGHVEQKRDSCAPLLLTNRGKERIRFGLRDAAQGVGVTVVERWRLASYGEMGAGHVGLGDVSSPTVLGPVDTEDYFELAYEADEFGVHIPEHSAAD